MKGGDEGRYGDGHPPEEELHRLAERGEAARDTDPAALHLRACAACRGEVEEIRALRRGAAGLPREIEPPRDLWPAIEARVRDAPGTGAPEDAAAGRGRRLGDLRLRAAAPWLAAAAALLVAVTAGTTMWLADGPERRTANASAATSGAVRPAGLQEVESSYRPVVERLTAVLEAREDRLPSETRAALERSLRIIDASIAEAERALRSEAPSAERLRAVDRSYRRKIEMLQRSVRLTAQL